MTKDPALRNQLIDLVVQIQTARDYGGDAPDALEQFEQLLPDTDVDNFCCSDYDSDTIVDLCLGQKDAERKLTPEELLALIKQFEGPISKYFTTDAEYRLAVMTFRYNCKHPAGTDLLFYPDEHLNGCSDPTSEEIWKKALNGE